jgi:hypothetical protein
MIPPVAMGWIHLVFMLVLNIHEEFRIIHKISTNPAETKNRSGQPSLPGKA